MAGGFLGGLSNLIEKIGELAEKAEQIRKERADRGEDVSDPSKDIKIVSGFTIRTGLGKDAGNGGADIKVEPFGNVRKDAKTGQTVVHEAREPLVDVFDEADHILVVAELPGVTAEDVKLDLAGDVLTLEASRGEKKYRKEVHLPAACDAAKMTHACGNGVLEVRLGK